VRIFAGGTFQILYTLYGSAASDRLGSTMAGLGDINGDGLPDFVVGSRNSSSNASFAGAAQVHSGDGTLIFRLEGANAGDFFGKRVAYAGDMTGDGISDFLVGANRFDGAAGSSTGAVFLFSGADASLVFTVEGENADDRMGGNIVGGHDLNGDGIPDFLVSSNGGGAGGLKAGTVSAYSSTGSKLFALYGEAPANSFGTGLCFAGDLDGDGVSDFATGSSQSGLTGPDNGRLGFYSGATQQQLFSHGGVAPGGELGINISLLGDVDGDGSSEFLVGAPLADSTLGADGGRVLVFSMGDSGPAIWTQSLAAGKQAQLSMRNATSSGAVVFAWSVAGGGPISTPWGAGLLTPPVNQIPATADANGMAQIANTVPNGLRGLPIWFQAVDMSVGALSNGLAQFVQ